MFLIHFKIQTLQNPKRQKKKTNGKWRIAAIVAATGRLSTAAEAAELVACPPLFVGYDCFGFSIPPLRHLHRSPFNPQIIFTPKFAQTKQAPINSYSQTHLSEKELGHSECSACRFCHFVRGFRPPKRRLSDIGGANHWPFIGEEEIRGSKIYRRLTAVVWVLGAEDLLPFEHTGYRDLPVEEDRQRGAPGARLL